MQMRKRKWRWNDHNRGFIPCLPPTEEPPSPTLVGVHGPDAAAASASNRCLFFLCASSTASTLKKKFKWGF